MLGRLLCVFCIVCSGACFFAFLFACVCWSRYPGNAREADGCLVCSWLVRSLFVEREGCLVGCRLLGWLAVKSYLVCRWVGGWVGEV